MAHSTDRLHDADADLRKLETRRLAALRRIAAADQKYRAYLRGVKT